MKNRKEKLYSAAIALLCVVACNRESKTGLTTESLQWLNGDWENTADSALTITESWQTINDTVMQGDGFTIEKGDTISHEAMQIKILKDKMFFIPTVNNQNNGQPVVFALEESKNNSLVFTNPYHDFPQKIAYQKINDDSIAAYIEGTMQGKIQRIDFAYRRKK